jgi:hypothetical protein
MVGVYLGQRMSNEQCTSDKSEIGMIFGINIILMGFTYMCVWPHTQWRSLPPHSSKFLGTTAIANQQTHASHKIRMQTPAKYLNITPISRDNSISLINPEPPIVQSVITPIPKPTPIPTPAPIPQPKVEEEPPSWFSSFVSKISTPSPPTTASTEPKVESPSWLESIVDRIFSLEDYILPVQESNDAIEQKYLIPKQESNRAIEQKYRMFKREPTYYQL